MNPLSTLEQILMDGNYPLYGWTRLQQPLTIGYYREWLERKQHGSMQYLFEHFDKKNHPQHLARSAIVIGYNYVPRHPAPFEEGQDPIPHLRKAAYALGADYHYWLKEKLESLIVILKRSFPNEEFAAWTDSGPVLEKDLAYRSGLGWFGKNTCLISKKEGSFFLIGEIYTTLSLENQKPLSPDFCGTCQKCITHCPTQAIEKPYNVNALKCISYWTIESKEVPPVELRNKFADWIFGCDICQQVCPWNTDIISLKATPAQFQSPVDPANKAPSTATTFELKNQFDHTPQNSLSPMHQWKELFWILKSSHKELQRTFAGTALSRSAGLKLKRNALIVIGNWRSWHKDLLPKELRDLIIHEVSRFKQHPSLGELSLWCLELLA